MPVLLRIAVRNLMEHKSKSLIIGILIALGVVVLIVGNSFMDTAALGIERAFIDNYTGHIMISSKTEGKVSLFGVQRPPSMDITPILPHYREIRRYVESLEGVDAVTSQVTGYGIIGLPDEPGRSFAVLFGIEPGTYHEMFDNVEIIEGRYLEPGEEGLLMSLAQIERLEEEMAREQNIEAEEFDLELHAGDTIRISSYSDAGFKIRELPVVGIFDFKHTSEGVGADMITYVDAETIRTIQGLSLGSVSIDELTEEETFLLESDVETLFSEEAFTIEESDQGEFSEQVLESVLEPTAGGETDTPAGETLESAAPEEPGRSEIREDRGDGGGPTAWQYILLELEDPKTLLTTVAGLNEWFDARDILAEAGTWEDAAGPFATTADIIRSVFNVAIIIIGIVAVIIMMNTLVISVIERTSEIGTMRALGARKGFVWRMFFLETMTITALFGAVGIGFAALIVLILNRIGIPANNTFLKILFAGDVLQPEMSGMSVVTSILVVTGIGFLAHLYPVTVALKIPPIKAIRAK
jgi:putative ABC transport system permease protein